MTSSEVVMIGLSGAIVSIVIDNISELTDELPAASVAITVKE